jgi:hypothetical protein
MPPRKFFTFGEVILIDQKINLSNQPVYKKIRPALFHHDFSHIRRSIISRNPERIHAGRQ